MSMARIQTIFDIGNWNLFVIWNLNIEILLLIYKDKKSKI
jgi:hypothetical protein